MVNFYEFIKPPGGDDPPPGSAGASANLLSLMVEGIAEQQELVASAQARVFGLVCEAVQLALRNDRLFVKNDTVSAASREDWARRALVAELAAALRLSERKVTSMVETSETLVRELPETLAALREGTISVQHAEIMVSQAAGLDAVQRREFESTAIEVALTSTPPQLKRAAAAIRERLNPDTAAERKEQALQCRHLETCTAPDGMAYLTLYGPAETVLGIEAAARNTARSLRGAGDERTRAQIACDTVFDAIMTGFTTGGLTHNAATGNAANGSAAEGDDDGDGYGDGASRGPGGRTVTAGRIRPVVHVTVPVMTLLGRSAEPGSLEGYGPIDANTARRLAADAPSFTRLLTHPETGTILSVGRDRYTVPADLRRAVQIRDETCGFVGCNRPATSCEIDHREDWQYGGETNFDNLTALCTPHHRLKHETTWSVDRTDDGKLAWTSPLGRVYIIRPYTEPGYKRVVTFEETEPKTETVPPKSIWGTLPENPPF